MINLNTKKLQPIRELQICVMPVQTWCNPGVMLVSGIGKKLSEMAGNSANYPLKSI